MMYPLFSRTDGTKSRLLVIVEAVLTSFDQLSCDKLCFVSFVSWSVWKIVSFDDVTKFFQGEVVWHIFKIPGPVAARLRTGMQECWTLLLGSILMSICYTDMIISYGFVLKF